MSNEQRIQLPDVEHVEEPDFLKKYEWYGMDVMPYVLDVRERYMRPVYTLMHHGVEFAPLGGIHALTGQSGNGKTMTFTLLITALLGGNTGGDLRCALPEGTDVSVLYIDTEMEKGNTQLVTNRVHSMMGWQFDVPHEEFNVITLREVTESIDRWRLALKAIDTFRPTVVFIDGLLDLITDFNDNAACQEIIYDCMAIASKYGISVWCLVHENPGSTKMVGHLGSMLSRKVTDVFSTKKDRTLTGTQFTVQQQKARGKDVDDIVFTVSDGPANLGEPRLLDVAGMMAESRPSTSPLPTGYDWAQMLRAIIVSPTGIGTKDLTVAIKERMHVGQTRATEFINALVSDGYIHRKKNLRYYLGTDGISEQTLTTSTDEQPF